MSIYYKMHHCKSRHPHHCKPNIQLYYNLDDNLSIFASNTFGSTMIETMNGNLVNKSNTTVGRFAITNTIYDITDANQSGLFDVVSQTTFYLEKGNIQFSTAHQVMKDSQGKYIFPSGKTIFKILSGTGIYLKAKGYVVIYANNMYRKVKIFFVNSR